MKLKKVFFTGKKIFKNITVHSEIESVEGGGWFASENDKVIKSTSEWIYFLGIPIFRTKHEVVDAGLYNDHSIEIFKDWYPSKGEMVRATDLLLEPVTAWKTGIFLMQENDKYLLKRGDNYYSYNYIAPYKLDGNLNKELYDNQETVSSKY